MAVMVEEKIGIINRTKTLVVKLTTVYSGNHFLIKYLVNQVKNISLLVELLDQSENNCDGWWVVKL